jgi:hypothetical protein
MDDSQTGPVERLIQDVVGVVVAGFVLQGLWFGLTAMLAGARPELTAPLGRTSAALGIPWLGVLALGLAWAVKRARDASQVTGARR